MVVDLDSHNLNLILHLFSLNNNKASWGASHSQLWTAPARYTILLTVNLKHNDKDKSSKWAERLSVVLNFT